MFEVIRQNKMKTGIYVALSFSLLSAVIYFLAWYWGDFGVGGALMVAVIFSSISTIISYWNSDKIILRITKAHPANETDNKKVINAMEGLCIASGLPMPKVYIIDDDSMNAFATGRNPKHAVVCVTRGLLDRLDYYQLEGVLAHELGHIRNYDILLSTVVTVLVGMIVMLSHLFLRWGFRGRRGKDSNSSNAIIMIVGLILIILAPIFSQILKFTISRKREFMADATAVEFTRNPEGLASALELISTDSAVECADPATASMFIAEPQAMNFGTRERRNARKRAGLFDTHPLISERIKAIREIH